MPMDVQSIRFGRGDWADIQKWAEEAGMSASAYVRKATLILRFYEQGREDGYAAAIRAMEASREGS